MSNISSRPCVEKITLKLIASTELAAQLADLGLSLPEYHFSFIEWLRTRMADERHISVYFDEMFKEALSLERDIWNPSLHRRLPLERQSP